MKLFVFSKHALKRLRERGINRSVVIDALSAPDKVTKKSDYILCVKRLPLTSLVVIYRETDNSIFVITAYFSTKTKYFSH
jgi:hypothetical protein